MLRPTAIAAVALSAAIATLACARDRPSAGPADTIDDIEWSYRAASGPHGDPMLRLEREGMNASFDAQDLPEIMAALAASSGRSGEGAAFSVVREAGALACAGRVTALGTAQGTCRFDPDEGFLAALAARGLHPEDVGEMLGLALVDARLASVDALSRDGYRLEDVGALMAVAALGVTPAFVAELRDAGLVVTEVDDLVAARAVEVDAAWVREMAGAGYANLGIEKAIELKAMGVTPDYARRMTRVMRAMEGVE